MAKKPEPLTVREWWKHVGTDNVKLVVEAVDTSLPYVRLIGYRLKRPGYDFARRFIAACQQITPGFAPDLEIMMEPLPKRKPGRPATIQPSPEFQRQQRRGVAA